MNVDDPINAGSFDPTATQQWPGVEPVCFKAATSRLRTSLIPHPASTPPASLGQGLRAIDRLSEICERLSQAAMRAECAANSINGSEPKQPGNDISPAVPPSTIRSLCGTLDSLTSFLDEQVTRICSGIGC